MEIKPCCDRFTTNAEPMNIREGDYIERHTCECGQEWKIWFNTRFGLGKTESTVIHSRGPVEKKDEV